jgi:hypothetical protein
MSRYALIDSPRCRDFNGGVIQKSLHFSPRGQSLAKQLVNFSSLHDEERPADVFYHHRRNALVNALQMVI